MWQDIVYTVVGVVFSVSLIPSVWRCFRRLEPSNLSWWTIGPTAIGLFVLVPTAFSLGLWKAAIVNLLAALLWSGLGLSKAAFSMPRRGVWTT